MIVGDSNMSEHATFLKVGATSLLLPAVDNCDLVVVASSDAGVLTLDVRYTRREH